MLWLPMSFGLCWWSLSHSCLVLLSPAGPRCGRTQVPCEPRLSTVRHLSAGATRTGGGLCGGTAAMSDEIQSSFLWQVSP